MSLTSFCFNKNSGKPSVFYLKPKANGLMKFIGVTDAVLIKPKTEVA